MSACQTTVDQQVLEQNANNSFQMHSARTRGVQVGEFIVFVWWEVCMKDGLSHAPL